MIQVIAGKKARVKPSASSTWPTRLARKASTTSFSSTMTNRYMFDLRHEVRFINASEYELLSDHMFMGFLCGVVAQNFDVGLIFIDAFKKLIHNELATSEWVFKRLETISTNHNVDFVISVSAGPEELPDFIRPYVI